MRFYAHAHGNKIFHIDGVRGAGKAWTSPQQSHGKALLASWTTGKTGCAFHEVLNPLFKARYSRVMSFCRPFR